VDRNPSESPLFCMFSLIQNLSFLEDENQDSVCGIESVEEKVRVVMGR